MIIKLPSYVEAVFDRLTANMFECYIVGGCVRDAILHKEPHDWDITTNAKPSEIRDIFSDYHILDIGEKHGTITVIIEGYPVEITTYRSDGVYVDARHPESVSYVSNLKEDLERRDFTINAMAYNDEDGIIDYFNGQDDLKNKILRTVGDPDIRFNEDGLRILRALRFASVLNFSIEEATATSILANKLLLEKLSAERIREEFNKIITGENEDYILRRYRDVFAVFIPEIEQMFDYDQMNRYHNQDLYEHTLTVVKNVRPDLELRLAAFFHDIGKVSTAVIIDGEKCFYGHPIASREITESILQRMKYDKTTVNDVCILVERHLICGEFTNKSIKKLMNKTGEELFIKLLDLVEADKNSHASHNVFDKQGILDICAVIHKNKECFKLSDLKINGYDLIEMGFERDSTMKQVLTNILHLVMINELENDSEIIKKYVLEHREELKKKHTKEV